MAQPTTLYVTDDGKSFVTEAEALLHEKNMELNKKLRAYGTAAGIGKAQLTQLGKHFLAFRQFTELGLIPTPPTKRLGRPPKAKAATTTATAT